MGMGRKRTTDLDLPLRMRRKGCAYYYDWGGKPRKWEKLGSDKAGALKRWAEIQAGQKSGDTVDALVDNYLASLDSELAANTVKNYRIAKIAVAAVVAMIVFPPFNLRLPNGAVINLGYSFLLDPPMKGTYAGSVDIGVLLMQWIAVFLISGALWWLAKDKA